MTPFQKFQSPEGDDGSAGGGEAVGDRGDDFLATEDDLENLDAKKVVSEDAEDTTKADDSKKADDKDKVEDKDAKKDKEKFVPESRMNEAIRKHKDRNERLEERIKELEGTSNVTKTTADISEIEDILDKLQDQHEDALQDNDRAKSKAIRLKIRDAERTLIDLKATEKAVMAKVETLEELRYEAAISKAEEEYPILNPDSDEFDKEKADEVLDVRNSFMKNGQTATKALARAVKYVLGDAGKLTGKDKADEREVAAREKAAKAAKAQPPSTDKMGLDSDRAGSPTKAKSVARMTQDQFAKLDEDALATMRGDTME